MRKAGGRDRLWKAGAKATAPEIALDYGGPALPIRKGRRMRDEAKKVSGTSRARSSSRRTQTRRVNALSAPKNVNVALAARRTADQAVKPLDAAPVDGNNGPHLTFNFFIEV